MNTSMNLKFPKPRLLERLFEFRRVLLEGVYSEMGDGLNAPVNAEPESDAFL